MPAVIFVPSAIPAFKVARLFVLDRLLVAIHRAGAGPITIVSQNPLPRLERAEALGISVRVRQDVPVLEGPVLLASSNVLAQTGDVRRCLEAMGRLVSREGQVLPLGVGASPQVDLSLKNVPPVEAEGVAALVGDRITAQKAEKDLWAALSSSSDGVVDRLFNRPCGRPLSKFLIGTRFTPNMVSIASILMGMGSACFFAAGTYQGALLGAIFFQLSAIVDCVDGDVARMVFKETPLGKWLDIIGDQLVHVSVFLGIALGVYRAGYGSVSLWLGAIAAAGAIISFGVVLLGMRRGAARSGWLHRLVDASTNRDFSALVLVLACLQKLDLFLWLAAVGTHLFWAMALSLQFVLKPARRLEG